MAEKPSELNDQTSTDVNKNYADTIEKVSFRDNEDAENAGTNASADSSDPDEIRANIQETRSEMSETIDAIQEKLSYDNISSQVKEEVSEYVNETYQSVKEIVYKTLTRKAGEIMNYVEKGVNELSDTEVVKTARKNPIPLALIGLGIGMLLVNGFRGKKKNYRYDNYDINSRNYAEKHSSGESSSTLTAARNKMSDAAGAVSDSVSGAVGTVSEMAGTVSGKVSDVAGSVSGAITDYAGKAYNQVGNLGSYATDLAGTAQDQIEEHPLAVGAVALALGAAVGFSIPSTRVENRLMGEARASLMQKAQETARDAVGKVQQVAGQVTDTVKEEIKNQSST